MMRCGKFGTVNVHDPLQTTYRPPLTQQFENLKSTTEGRIFASQPISGIRTNPEQPTLPLLRQFLEANPQITPEACATTDVNNPKLQKVITDLEAQAAQLAEQSGQLIQSQMSGIPAIQSVVQQVQAKAERLGQLLEITNQHVQKFPESSGQIQALKRQLQLREAALAVVQRHQLLLQAPQIISQLLFARDLPNAALCQALTEISYHRHGIRNQELERQLGATRTAVECELRTQLVDCIFQEVLLDEHKRLPFIHKFFTDVTVFSELKTAAEYQEFLCAKRTQVAVKCGTWKLFCDFTEKLQGATDIIQQSNVAILSQKNHQLAGFEEMCLQEYALILGQSCLILEYAHKESAIKGEFQLYEQVLSQLTLKLENLYFTTEQYVRNGTFEHLSIVQSKVYKISANDQLAKQMLVNPQTQKIKPQASQNEIELFKLSSAIFFVIYNIQMISRVVDIALKVTDNPIVLEKLKLCSSDRFVLNYGQALEFIQCQYPRLDLLEFFFSMNTFVQEFCEYFCGKEKQSKQFQFCQSIADTGALFELSMIQIGGGKLFQKTYYQNITNYIVIEMLIQSIVDSIQYYGFQKKILLKPEDLQKAYFQRIKSEFKQQFNLHLNMVQKGSESLSSKIVLQMIKQLQYVATQTLCIPSTQIELIADEIEELVIDTLTNLIEQKCRPIVSFGKSFENSTLDFNPQDTKKTAIYGYEYVSQKFYLMNIEQVKFCVNIFKYLGICSDFSQLYSSINCKQIGKLQQFQEKVLSFIRLEQSYQIKYFLIKYNYSRQQEQAVNTQTTSLDARALQLILDCLSQTNSTLIEDDQIDILFVVFKQYIQDQLKQKLSKDRVLDILMNMQLLLLKFSQDARVDELLILVKQGGK